MAEQTKAPTKGQDAEKAQERKKRPEPAPEHTGALAAESISLAGLLGDSAMELPVERHAALLGDPRLSQTANAVQRARIASELQQSYGNAHMQRVMENVPIKKNGKPIDEKIGTEAGRSLFTHDDAHAAKNSEGGLYLKTGAKDAERLIARREKLNVAKAVSWGEVQRSWLGEVWGWLRTRLGGKKYAEKKAKELHEKLEKAHQLVEAAETIAQDSDIRRRLSSAKNALEKVNKPLGQYLNVRDKICNVIRVIDAVDDFSKADASKNAQRFARSAGKLFSSIGELGKGLPVAGYYFELLSKAGNFFTNMQHALDPGLRWRHRPEAKYLP